MNTPSMPIPAPLRMFVTWLKNRRGLDLFKHINFLNGFEIAGIRFDAEDAKILRALLDAQKAKMPRNKHPAKSRDDPEPETASESLLGTGE